MPAVELDYERLNEAAQIVFDVAKARGEHEGGERERLKAAALHADSTLYAAYVFLGFAQSARARGETAEAKALAVYARRMLGQTPLLAERLTMTASGLLDSHRMDGMDDDAAEGMATARARILDARDYLRTQYDGLGPVR